MLAAVLSSCGDSGAAKGPSPDQLDVLDELCATGGAVTAPSIGDTTTASASAAPAEVPAATGETVSLPLLVDSDRGLIVGADARPFRIQGDAAWSLIAGLQRDDVELYLESRAASGFNTLLVNLIEHRFVEDAPANAYGDEPFTGDAFSTPNEAYFDYADWVIERAGELGFVLLLTPAYIGFEGTSQGWYEDMEGAGVDVLYEYGRYVGERFGHHQNIIWVNAGDADPEREELIDAVARGIRDTDPDALQTAHGAPGTPAAAVWGDYDWLDVNNVYSYDPPYVPSIEQYVAGARPFFFIEGTYENEFDATTKLLRIQAYHTMLAGAIGQVFGNNPMWHFDGPGLHDFEGIWQDALSSPGTSSMEHLDALFGSLPWWTLVPDYCDEFVVGDVGDGFDRTVAAVSVDRTLAVVYTVTGGPVEVDLSRLDGDEVTARWFDPTSGQFGEPRTMTIAGGTPTTLTPSGLNAEADEDWVLVLEAATHDG